MATVTAEMRQAGSNAAAVSDATGGGKPEPGEIVRHTPDVRAMERVRVKSTDLILFTTQLAVMLDSGVILSDALDAIGEQAADPRFKAVILDLSERVKSGEMFSKALAFYPGIFNRMFISMVKASEASGKMVEMLTVLTGYLTFEADTRKRVLGALTYPLIMVLMAIAATGTLMFFVLPRFMRIYETRGAALPKLTRSSCTSAASWATWRSWRCS